jgi:hypothetical protein
MSKTPAYKKTLPIRPIIEQEPGSSSGVFTRPKSMGEMRLPSRDMPSREQLVQDQQPVQEPLTADLEISEIVEAQNVLETQKLPDVQPDVQPDERHTLIHEVWGQSSDSPLVVDTVDTVDTFDIVDAIGSIDAKVKTKSKPGKALRNRKVVMQIAVFAIALGAGAAVLQLGTAAATALRAKSAVLGATTAGLQSLSEGAQLASTKQFTDSQNQFSLAQGYFLQGTVDLSSDNALVSALIAATPQGQSAKKILAAGTSMSQAGSDLAQLNALSKGIQISAAGFQTPDGFSQTLIAMGKYASSAQVELNNAQSQLSSVDPSSVPEQYRAQLTAASQQIQTYAQATSELQQLLALVQEFFGPGPKTVLVLFENNNELRPGGGFIGTYGYYDFNNGQITSQKISSIYDLDGQLHEKIAPPGEFVALTDSWALRDSNWFADFRDSAQKASGFYELEAKETPDSVIAITPDLFEDILKITGPVAFPKYNVTLTADNFRDTVQMDTSNKTSSAPKQMLSDFAPLLLQQIAALPTGSNQKLVSALLDNLKRKNIMVYDRNPDVESQLIADNWAGSLASTNKDYLAISAANLGGQKTDLNISQQLSMQSQVQADGSIVDTITYTRSHANILTDPKNRDYIRFLVPAGAQLISANGFTREPYYKADGSAYSSFEDTSKFIIDPELAAIDASASVDPQSGVVTTSEDGKTVFGNWMEIGPGQNQQVTLSYKLPFKFNGQSQSLIVQKQPGATDIDMQYTFGMASGAATDNSSSGSVGVLPKFIWYTPYGADTSNGQFRSQQTINQDIFFGQVFDSSN